MDIRNILMIVSLVLSLILGMLLGRGGLVTNSESSGRARIGLSLDTLKEARWQTDRDLFVAKAAEMGMDVLVNSANSDCRVSIEVSGVNVLIELSPPRVWRSRPRSGGRTSAARLPVAERP